MTWEIGGRYRRTRVYMPTHASMTSSVGKPWFHYTVWNIKSCLHGPISTAVTTSCVHRSFPVFMAALCNRAGHYIFALWFLSIYLSFFLSFFLDWSQRPQIGCLPYFHTWCGPSANLECRSEMCCTRLAGNTGRKNRHFGTIAELCRAISSELRHVSTIGKIC